MISGLIWRRRKAEGSAATRGVEGGVAEGLGRSVAGGKIEFQLIPSTIIVQTQWRVVFSHSKKCFFEEYFSPFFSHMNHDVLPRRFEMDNEYHICSMLRWSYFIHRWQHIPVFVAPVSYTEQEVIITT